MKNIKGFNLFNESKIGDSIRNTFNKDEYNGVRILKKITNLTKDDPNQLELSKLKNGYKFCMHGVEYNVKNLFGMYVFIRDGVELKISRKTIKDIYNKSEEIFISQQKSNKK